MLEMLISHAASAITESLDFDQQFELAKATNGAESLDQIAEPWRTRVSDLINRRLSLQKHATHDQKTHGNWANGFSEDTQGEEAQGIYFDKYGYKTDGSNEPVGISSDEISSLNSYTEDGYWRINHSLRGNLPTRVFPSRDVENMNELTQQRINHLDKLIEESPNIFGGTTLYRIFSEKVLLSIEEGDVLTDKAFLSTTRIDITNPKNIKILESLKAITSTKDMAAVIIPSPSKKGKGLAVDYIKNALPRQSVTNLSTALEEKEVLLPRGTSLKLMGFKNINLRTDNEMTVAVFQRMDK